MKRRLLLALLVVPLISCASAQKQLVQDATASFIWWNHEYKKNCVEVAGPPECRSTFIALEQLREDTTVLNEAQKIGTVPKAAIAKLKTSLKSLDEDPVLTGKP